MSSDATPLPPVTTWRQIAGIIWRALLTAVALLPLTLGFLAGLAFWALRWLWVAAVVGFEAGNADGPVAPVHGADE